MKTALYIAFKDEKGIECSRCMLKTIMNAKEVCTGLGTRPTCSKSGKLNECPLLPVEEIDDELKDSISCLIIRLRNRKPYEGEVFQAIHSMPQEILALGIKWGYYDTEFIQETYCWMHDEFQFKQHRN